MSLLINQISASLEEHSVISDIFNHFRSKVCIRRTLCHFAYWEDRLGFQKTSVGLAGLRSAIPQRIQQKGEKHCSLDEALSAKTRSCRVLLWFYLIS